MIANKLRFTPDMFIEEMNVYSQYLVESSIEIDPIFIIYTLQKALKEFNEENTVKITYDDHYINLEYKFDGEDNIITIDRQFSDNITLFNDFTEEGYKTFSKVFNKMLHIYCREIDPNHFKLHKDGDVLDLYFPYFSKYFPRRKRLIKILQLNVHSDKKVFKHKLLLPYVRKYLYRIFKDLGCKNIKRDLSNCYTGELDQIELSFLVSSKLLDKDSSRIYVRELLSLYLILKKYKIDKFDTYEFNELEKYEDYCFYPITLLTALMENIAKSIHIRRRLTDRSYSSFDTILAPEK